MFNRFSRSFRLYFVLRLRFTGFTGDPVIYFVDIYINI
ncbi:hypothetical protein [uncultured Gammaproteobacteria bacterium]|nr:hypothetical protein [uncultured Gammaproteobacteria bacterium]